MEKILKAFLFTYAVLIVTLVIKVGFDFPPTNNMAAAISATSPAPMSPAPTGKLFLMGGVQGGGGLIAPDVWSSTSPQTSNWTLLNNNVVGALGFPTAVYFNNKLWLLGGGQASNMATSDVYSSSDGITWTFVTTAPWGPRTAHKVVVFNDSGGNAIYIIGGAGYNDIWKSYNGTTWTQVLANAPWPAYPQASEVQMAVVFNNEIWISTEVHSSPYLIAEVWHSSNGSAWTQAPNAPWGDPYRIGYSSVSFGGKLWILGGVVYNNSYSDSNDVWSSLDGITWAQSATPPWLGREGHASVVFNGNMWVIGGRHSFGGGYNFNDSWYSSNGTTWTQANPASAPWLVRGYHAMVVTPVSFGTQPDLLVTDDLKWTDHYNSTISIANQNYGQGSVSHGSQYVYFKAVIKNIGTAPLLTDNMTFKLYKGSVAPANVYGSLQFGNTGITIAPSATYTIYFKNDIPPVGSAGTYHLILVGDTANIILESNETNNTSGAIPFTVI